MGKLLFFTSIVVFATAGCGEAVEGNDCRSGEPRPIFTDSLAGIRTHVFTVTAQRSVEDIAFSDGTTLLIEQRGCDTLFQEFELDLADSVAMWPLAQAQIGARFDAYANLAPQLLGLGQYAEMIRSIPQTAPEARPENLAPGLSVRYYRVPSPLGDRWRIGLTQDLSGLDTGQ